MLLRPLRVALHSIMHTTHECDCCVTPYTVKVDGGMTEGARRAARDRMRSHESVRARERRQDPNGNVQDAARAKLRHLFTVRAGRSFTVKILAKFLKWSWLDTRALVLSMAQDRTEKVRKLKPGRWGYRAP